MIGYDQRLSRATFHILMTLLFYMIYNMCVCLHTVVFNTYCVVFLFC